MKCRVVLPFSPLVDGVSPWNGYNKGPVHEPSSRRPQFWHCPPCLLPEAKGAPGPVQLQNIVLHKLRDPGVEEQIKYDIAALWAHLQLCTLERLPCQSILVARAFLSKSRITEARDEQVRSRLRGSSAAERQKRRTARR